MPLPRHQSYEAQPRKLPDARRELRRGFARRHAAALHARVHFHHHRDDDVLRGCRGAQLPGVGIAVNGGDDAAVARQSCQACQFSLPRNLVGQQDVPDACPRHRLRFVEGRAGDPDGPGGNGFARQFRRLLPLHVRTPGQSAIADDVVRHARQVTAVGVQVQAQCRCFQVVDGQADGIGIGAHGYILTVVG